jgi:glycosyltransferase involved in cell wall biosynthesis
MSNDEIKMVQHGLGVNGPPIGIIRPAKECIMPDALIDRSNVVSDVGEYVLFVGDLANERKNALPLIEACEKAKYPLAMIGSLNKTAYGSRVLSAINNSQYTKYYGMLNARVDVLAAMRHCRVFALPSITEGIGIAALEAGILGARVVATCNGGIREYLGTNAWYVNPESCISIYKGIVSAWTATHRPPLNQHIADNLTLRNTAKSMIDLYSRALRR